MENLTQRWTQSAFFPKSGTCLDCQERAGEASPFPPRCALVSVAEYALMSLNILENPTHIKWGVFMQFSIHSTKKKKKKKKRYIYVIKKTLIGDEN